MNYTEVMKELSTTPLFDLYRLNVAIEEILRDERRIQQIRNHLQIGEAINYFDARENRLRPAVVLKLKTLHAVVRDIGSNYIYEIFYCLINLEGKEVDIKISQAQGSRNYFKVGEEVSFYNKEGEEVIGRITQLNLKTVSLKTRTGHKWRVSYKFLNPTKIFTGEESSPEILISEIEESP